MTYLVLVRHGQSAWNLKNIFTGKVDIPLSKKGIKEAEKCAHILRKIEFDIAFTSKLARAEETLMIILSEQKKVGIVLHNSKKEKEWNKHYTRWKRNELPIYTSSAITERYYGRLQGFNKNTARKKYGKMKVFLWRRSWDVRPPMGESLKDTYRRVIPYFKRKIMKEVEKKKNVIVTAHGNSLRAIIKYIENISNEDIPYLEIPTGKPIIYRYYRGKLERIKYEHHHDLHKKIK